MNHSACSTEGVEAHRSGPGAAVFMCVFHLVASVVVALVAIGALAIIAPIN